MLYVGKSECPFNLRLYNYKHRIQSTAYKKLLSVLQHFRLGHYDVSIYAKFTIIGEIEKSSLDHIILILETHEDNWILRLETSHPDGFNSKLSHPKIPFTIILWRQMDKPHCLVQLLLLHRLHVANQHIKNITSSEVSYSSYVRYKNIYK